MKVSQNQPFVVHVSRPFWHGVQRCTRYGSRLLLNLSCSSQQAYTYIQLAVIIMLKTYDCDNSKAQCLLFKSTCLFNIQLGINVENVSDITAKHSVYRPSLVWDFYEIPVNLHVRIEAIYPSRGWKLVSCFFMFDAQNLVTFVKNHV